MPPASTDTTGMLDEHPTAVRTKAKASQEGRHTVKRETGNRVLFTPPLDRPLCAAVKRGYARILRGWIPDGKAGQHAARCEQCPRVVYSVR